MQSCRHSHGSRCLAINRTLPQDVRGAGADAICAIQSCSWFTHVLGHRNSTGHCNIAYAVSVLGRYSSNPGLEHWKAVMHLFRYIKGTKNFKLVLGPSKESGELFTTYSDANYGGCKSTGRSTGAYIVKVGSGVVSWSSKLQPFVTGSTAEAEYIAAYFAGLELVFLRNFLEELGYPIPGASTLYVNNQPAIAVAKNPEHHG